MKMMELTYISNTFKYNKIILKQFTIISKDNRHQE